MDKNVAYRTLRKLEGVVTVDEIAEVLRKGGGYKDDSVVRHAIQRWSQKGLYLAPASPSGGIYYNRVKTHGRDDTQAAIIKQAAIRNVPVVMIGKGAIHSFEGDDLYTGLVNDPGALRAAYPRSVQRLREITDSHWHPRPAWWFKAVQNELIQPAPYRRNNDLAKLHPAWAIADAWAFEDQGQIDPDEISENLAADADEADLNRFADEIESALKALRAPGSSYDMLESLREELQADKGPRP